MFNSSFLIPLIKNYKLNSVFIRNFVLIFFLIAIPLNSSCMFFYVNASKSARQEMEQSSITLTTSLKNTIDNEVNGLKYLAVNIALHKDTQNYILSSITANKAPNTENLDQYMEYCINMNKSIDSMYIYCKQNDTVLSNGVITSFATLKDSGWLEEYDGMNINDIKIVLRKRNNNYPYYLSIIKPIPLSHNNNLGCVVININIQKLTKTFKDSIPSSSQNIYIVTDDNRILYHGTSKFITQSAKKVPFLNKISKSSKNSSETIKFENEKYIVSSVSSRFFDWSYYSSAPMSLYNERGHALTLLMIYLTLIALIVSLVTSVYISFKTYLPINNIIELMNHPDKLMVQLYTETPQNETDYILNRLSHILHMNKQFETELNDRLLMLRHTQTSALQAQINPHFLYNILDNINWLAVDLAEGDNDVSKAVVMLADLFKFNIDNANYLTSLSDEFIYTEKYIEILKLRYKDKFNIHWKIDEKTKEYTTPRFILQPVIENAVYHGIKPMDKKGNITIKSELKNDKLIITVTDDGVGIDINTLIRINQEFSETYVSSEKHIGLKNVNQRIKLIFGNNYGIQLSSRLNFGTSAILKLPAIIK